MNLHFGFFFGKLKKKENWRIEKKKKGMVECKPGRLNNERVTIHR